MAVKKCTFNGIHTWIKFITESLNFPGISIMSENIEGSFHYPTNKTVSVNL